jgi:hypothetical protein
MPLNDPADHEAQLDLRLEIPQNTSGVEPQRVPQVSNLERVAGGVSATIRTARKAAGSY